MRIDGKFFIFPFFLFLLLGTVSAAAHAPGSPPPHGGQLYQGKSHFYEMVVSTGEIRLYVLNRALKPVPINGMEGSLTVKFSDRPAMNMPLEPNGEFFKVGLALDAPKSFIAVATLKINGKDDTGRFAF